MYGPFDLFCNVSNNRLGKLFDEKEHANFSPLFISIMLYKIYNVHFDCILKFASNEYFMQKFTPVIFTFLFSEEIKTLLIVAKYIKSFFSKSYSEVLGNQNSSHKSYFEHSHGNKCY